jgi:lysyl-tRNA synthetase class 1
MSSMTYEDGTALFLPEVDKATLDAVAHWSERARNLKHPVLRARYADVVWELGRFITKSPTRDVAMARIAINAYIEAVTHRLDGNTHAVFTSAQRAIDLAAQINDPAGIDRARKVLLSLHA